MDAALIWNGTAGDVAVVGNDLLTDSGLATAVVVSLCSDGRATFNDELPAGVTERRGWWGVDSTGWGSKLWLLSREKTTAKTAARAREYAIKALQWMVDDGIAQSVNVTAEVLNPSTIAVAVKISRGTNRKYDYLWAGMAPISEYSLTIGNGKVALESNDIVVPEPDSVEFDFINRKYPAVINLSRPGTGATYFDSTGTMRQAAANEFRYNYDPLTLAPLGLLVEPLSINQVRNSDFSGALIGTLGSGGSLGTGWSISAGTGGGLTTEVVGIGTELGMRYLELLVTGTATGTEYQIESTSTAADPGTVFVVSGRLKDISGRNTVNVTDIQARDIQGGFPSSSFAVIGSGSIPGYQQASRTLNSNGTGVQMRYRFTTNAGATINYRFRIYTPKLETSLTTASSHITTTGVAVTRAADAYSLTLPYTRRNVEFMFDDGSTQTLFEVPQDFTIPTNLNRPNIAKMTVRKVA